MLVGYADESTLLCRISDPCDRASVAASLNDDLGAISDWCSKWSMLANLSKTRGMLISLSRTVEPLFPDLFIDGCDSLRVDDFGRYSWLKVDLWKASQSNSCFCFEEDRCSEEHYEYCQRCLGCCQILLGIQLFILPVLECCSQVWMSAASVATSHLLLLDRVVDWVSQLSGGSVSCDLWHRRRVDLCGVSSILIVWLVTQCLFFSAQYVMRRNPANLLKPAEHLSMCSTLHKSDDRTIKTP